MLCAVVQLAVPLKLILNYLAMLVMTWTKNWWSRTLVWRVSVYCLKGRVLPQNRVYLPGGGGTCLGGVTAQRGVPAWGVYLPRGVPAGGCTCPGGVPARGGGTCPVGVPAGGCVSQHALGLTPPLWTDRHLWKHNLRKLRLRAVINHRAIRTVPHAN